MSHDVAAGWMDKAIDLVATHAERACARGDPDFPFTVNVDRWSEKADFIFSYDAQPTLVTRAEALEQGHVEAPRAPAALYPPDEDDTQEAGRREGTGRAVARLRQQAGRLPEDMAESRYKRPKCRTRSRKVVVRKNISET